MEVRRAVSYIIIIKSQWKQIMVTRISRIVFRVLFCIVYTKCKNHSLLRLVVVDS